MTLWDETFGDADLRKWLYGERSLQGQTRSWFLTEAKTWPEGTKLLDAGCGGGVTAYQMKEVGLLDKIYYTGIDFSQCMIDLAHKMVSHRNIEWVLASLEKLNPKFSEKFDRVLLRAVLAHVLDPVPVLKSVAGTIKNGGTLYIVFWNNPAEKESIIGKAGKFWDIGHSGELLSKTLFDSGIKMECAYICNESSARDNQRVIWQLRKTNEKVK